MHKHKFPYSTETCSCGLRLGNYDYSDIQKIEETKGDKSSKKFGGFGVDCFSTPRWNQGLGCHTSSIRETEKKAKAKGLTPIGDARIDQVFKPRTGESKQIVKDLIREHRDKMRITI